MVAAGFDLPGAMDLVVLGRIGAPFGVNGWVKVTSSTEPSTNILQYPIWQLQLRGEWRPYKLLQGRAHGKSAVALLEGCSDRDQAALLTNALIAVARAELPEPDPDEVYWADLEGLMVVNTEGVVLGKVAYLFATGANDVLVVQGAKQHLIPVVSPEIIKEIDFNAGKITVIWDEDF